MAENEKWGTRIGFVLAAIGSAIGLGNIWRFPYQVYNSGGGAFLIPYFAALIIAGIPVLILELGLGGETGKTTPLAIREKLRESEFIGWWAVLNGWLVNMYYAVIVGWSVVFVGFSLTLAWQGTELSNFFMNNFLNSWLPVVGVILVWILQYFIMKAGIKEGLEKANKIFVPAIWVIVILLVLRGITLDGAIQGLNYYLTPDFGALTNAEIWINAFGQIYFTLSVALGIMITYASYLPEKSDITNNAFIIALANCGFAFLVGFAIFPIMVAGGIEPTSGIGLAFMALPKAFEFLPFSNVFASLFFVLLTMAGLSSSISLAEAQIGPIREKLTLKRSKTVSYVIAISLIGSLIIALEGPLGLFGDNPLSLLTILDTSSATYTLPIIAFGEALIFGWVYGIDKIRTYVNSVSDYTMGTWFNYFLKIVVPIALGYSILSKTVTRPGLLPPFLIMIGAALASIVKEQK
ncbi:MAG: Na+-dependent transporter of the SNF family [Candidatus Methanohalarchaeum thermophilum]|uniref:Transporter n=1 Tax=Methanohalarchaeum thermophilum TaxID=1903181 RepID=A0A1Q6DT11_METT1|nr:MAG: Na+-dependent transporter of the SNF family [Candidatus Methanohalarchaeum thermophilum]